MMVCELFGIGKMSFMLFLNLMCSKTFGVRKKMQITSSFLSHREKWAIFVAHKLYINHYTNWPTFKKFI